MKAKAIEIWNRKYGWVMVALAPIFLGTGSGFIISFSIFLKPLSAEFGWQRGETALGYLAATFSLGLGGILMGHIADRWPIRRVVLIGALSLAAASLLLANLSSLWELYLYNCLLGGFGSAAMFSPLLVSVGKWFDRNKGLALGITTAGHAGGQGVFIFIARQLISDLGWREAYVTLGLASLVLLVPLVFLMRDPAPGALELESGSDEPAVLPAPPYLISPRRLVPWLSAGMIFICICIAVPTVHVAALTSDLGFDPEMGARVLGLVMVTGVFGRIFFGKLADRVGGIRAYLIASAVQAAVVFWFTQSDSIHGIYLVAMVFGFAQSGIMTSVVFSVRELVPEKVRGICQGIMLFFGSVGMGLGGLQGGYFYDLTGTYVVPFAIAVAAAVVNLGLVSALYLYLRRRKTASRGLAQAGELPAPGVPALQAA